MRSKIVLILGAIALIALVVAGCGGGSDSTSGSTAAKETPPSEGSSKTTKSDASPAEKPLTKTQFNTRVNEICIQVPPGYEAKLKELEKGGKKLSKSESNLKAAVPPLRAAIEEMEAIKPPAGEEQTLQKVFTALRNAADGVEESPTSKLSGPSSPFAEFQKVTKELGFETCSGL
jgi:FtsZ-interacting cell division protein ZipA